MTRANSSIRDETRRTCGSAPAPPVDGIILVMALVKRTGPGKTRRDEGDVDWVDWMDGALIMRVRGYLMRYNLRDR